MNGIETLTTLEQLEALAPEWRALLQKTSLRTPSRSPLWQLTWWRHFGSRRTSACRHEMRVFVVRDAGGALVAVAPMTLTHRPGFGPSLFRELQFFGADPYVTQLRGPVCERARLAEVTERLVAFVKSRKEHDFVQWRGMAPGFGDRADNVRQPRLDDIDCVLPMRESWDAFHAALPKKTRKHMRKSQNDIKVAGHRLRLPCGDEPAGIGGGPENLLRIAHVARRTEGRLRASQHFRRRDRARLPRGLLRANGRMRRPPPFPDLGRRPRCRDPAGLRPGRRALSLFLGL